MSEYLTEAETIALLRLDATPGDAHEQLRGLRRRRALPFIQVNARVRLYPHAGVRAFLERNLREAMS